MKPKSKTLNTAQGMYCMGFTFTCEQVRRMERAEKSAEKYMQSYGQGIRRPQIDYRNYVTLCSRQKPN